MYMKANGCWPVIAVAGFLMLGAAPVRACDTAHCESRHHAHHASGSHSKQANTSDQKKTDTADQKDNTGKAGGPGLSSAVANANAQMIAPAENAASPAAPAAAQQPAADAASQSVQASVNAPNAPTDVTPSADSSPAVVAADELNEVDRAATPEKPTGRVLHPVPPTPHLANATSDDTWSQTSLIGKVFIVLGGFLTVASAARMFIA